LVSNHVQLMTIEKLGPEVSPARWSPSSGNSLTGGRPNDDRLDSSGFVDFSSNSGSTVVGRVLLGVEIIPAGDVSPAVSRYPGNGHRGVPSDLTEWLQCHRTGLISVALKYGSALMESSWL